MPAHDSVTTTVRGVNLPLTTGERGMLIAVDCVGPASGYALDRANPHTKSGGAGGKKGRAWKFIMDRRLVTKTPWGWVLTDKGREVLAADAWLEEGST